LSPCCRVEFKALPNAPKTQVIGWLGEAIKVKLHAPALDGKANVALCSFLAESLCLPRSSIRLLKGETSRKKLVEISGLTREQVIAVLLP